MNLLETNIHHIGNDLIKKFSNLEDVLTFSDEMNVWGAARSIPKVKKTFNSLNIGSVGFELEDGTTSVEVSIALRYGDLRIGFFIANTQFGLRSNFEQYQSVRWKKSIENAFEAFDMKSNAPGYIARQHEHGYFIDFLFSTRKEGLLFDDALLAADAMSIKKSSCASVIRMITLHLYLAIVSVIEMERFYNEIESLGLQPVDVFSTDSPSDFARKYKIPPNLMTLRNSYSSEQKSYFKVYCNNKQKELFKLMGLLVFKT